jgi:hypothetical protein
MLRLNGSLSAADRGVVILELQWVAQPHHIQRIAVPATHTGREGGGGGTEEKQACPSNTVY